MKPKIAPHLKNQTHYYFSGFKEEYDLEGASQIDESTIRIWMRNKESHQLTCRLFPYLKDDKVDAIGVDNGDKIVDILK